MDSDGHQEHEGQKEQKGGWAPSLQSWSLLRPAQWRRNRWFLLAVAGGVLLMVLGNVLGANPSAPVDFGVGGAGPPPPVANPATMAVVEAQLAALLTDHLSQVAGAGPLQVLVSLETDAEQVFIEDRERTQRRTEESDAQGGQRLVNETDESIHVLWQPGLGGGREPVRRTTRAPRVRGVLVVAAGATDARVRLHLTHGVQALLDIPPHRIAIVPGGGE